MNMKRREQYELFSKFLETEESRYDHLTQRASILIGFLSGLSLFAGLNIEDLLNIIQKHVVSLALLTISGIALLASVLCAVISIRIREYKDICDVEKFVVEIDENQYDEDDIFSLLLAKLADTIAHNRSINDHRARWLEWAVMLLAASLIAFIALNIAIAIIHYRGGP